MLLGKDDFLGLLFFLGLNFIPMFALFVSASIRTQEYMSGKRVTRKNGVAVSEPWTIDFMMTSRAPYDFIRRNSTGRMYILPYELFIVVVVGGSVLNALSMFWVWMSPSHYADWAYETTLFLQVANVLLVSMWKYSFFHVPNYMWTVYASFALTVISFTILIILLVVSPKRWNVYVFNGLVALYYLFLLAMSSTFRRANCMNRLHRIEGDLFDISLINAILGEPTREEQLSAMPGHGFELGNGNHVARHTE